MSKSTSRQIAQNTLTVFKGVLLGAFPYLLLVCFIFVVSRTTHGPLELGFMGFGVLFMWSMLIEFFVGIGFLFSPRKRLLGVSMLAILLPIALFFIEGHLYIPT